MNDFDSIMWLLHAVPKKVVRIIYIHVLSFIELSFNIAKYRLKSAKTTIEYFDNNIKKWFKNKNISILKKTT